MFKSSKVINGMNGGRVLSSTTLHSIPLGNPITNPLLNWNPPILPKRVESMGEPVNREGSGTQLNERVFSLLGISSSEPSILLSSNFIPIWEGNKLNPAGESVYLREVSRMVNSKVSLSILSGTSGSMEYTELSRGLVYDYIDREEGGGFSRNLLDLTESTTTSLDLGESGLVGILRSGGYTTEKIKGFSPTKIYTQSLVELKRYTSTHSPKLISQVPTRGEVLEDLDPFLISDIDTLPNNSVRYWFNPNYSIPDVDSLITVEKIGENLSLLQQYSSVQFVKFTGEGKVEVSPRSILDQYNSENGTDLSLLGNLLLKEGNFSNTLKSGEVREVLSSRYGYTLSTVGGNFQLWDYLFGRFTTSVLDPVTNPTGMGNSLSSLSSQIVPLPGSESYYHVLTWENSPVTGSTITPGVEYYVDSLSTTPEGNLFDTTRLNSLVKKTSYGVDTINLIGNMLGRNPNGNLKNFSPISFLWYISRLSGVSTLYSYCTTLTPEGFGGMDSSKLRTLPLTEQYGIRISSLICKVCIHPTEGYRGVSERLKSLLFMWIMNLVILRERTSQVQAKCWVTIEKLRGEISDTICGVFTPVERSELLSLLNEGRVTTYSSTNYGFDTSSRNVKSSTPYKQFVNSFMDTTLTVEGNNIWKILTDTLYELGNNYNIYTGGVTGYSNLTRETYLYHSFELLLRIISSQVPENLLGSFSTGNTNGILTDSPTSEILGEYFSPSIVKQNREGNNYSGVNISVKLSNSWMYSNGEDEIVLGNMSTLQRKVGEVYTRSRSLLSFLQGEISQNWLRVVKPLYDGDPNLTSGEKSTFLNLSLSREQFVSSLWRESEYLDRVGDEKWLEVLRSHPTLTDLPEWCANLLPLNPLKLISFPTLSPYFRGNSFQKVTGNNLRILSVGIPHRLNRTLRSSPTTVDPTSNVIRIRVFKLDRLHPDIVYNPQEFLFEMNRFPTRSLTVWNLEEFLGNGTNHLEIPTKLVNHHGDVVNCKNYGEGFPYDTYGNSLNEFQKMEIYSNHTTSFLLEEYLRWFSGVELDEMGWSCGNSSLSTGSPILEEGYTLLQFNSVGKSGRYTFTGVNGTLVDTQGILIQPDTTVKMYLRNETLLLNPDTISRKHVYPRKFDRVFTLSVDPDNFTVDPAYSTASTLTSLVDLGVIIHDERSGVYFHRNTSERDISMDEYFVTVEPLGFVKEGV